MGYVRRRFICPYCGMACRLIADVSGGSLRAIPDPEDPVSLGSPCVRGLTVGEALRPGRLGRPMVRREKRGRAEPVDWGEAISAVVRGLSGRSPDEVHVAISGRVTNEDALALVRLALAVLGTPNVDGASARVCHSSTVGVLREVLGVPSSTGRLDDMDGLDLLLLAGTNPAVDYPPMYVRILRAKARGMRVIYLGAIRAETSRIADSTLLVRPGGEAAVLNYIAREVLASGLAPHASALHGFRDYEAWVSSYDRVRAEAALLVDPGELSRALDMVMGSKRMGVASGMGLTHGPNPCASLAALYDLAALKGALVMTMRGLVNVQGVGDMGACPGLGCWDEGHRAAAEARWGTLPRGGTTFTDALLRGKPGAVLMTEMNPIHSMPSPSLIEEALEGAFVVCMCSYLNETSELADVLLPVPLMPERAGTITNGERRVRPVLPAIPPHGQSLQEWEIAVLLSRALGREMGYSSVWDITREIKELVPGYKGLDLEALRSGVDQWADKSPHSPRLVVEEDLGPLEVGPDEWILVDLRSPHHFLGGEATWRVRSLARASGGPAILMNPEDLEELGLRGIRVRACTGAGCIEAPAAPSPVLPRGFVGYYLSNRGKRYNDLVPPRLSKCSMTPQYKYLAARLYVGQEPLRPPAPSAYAPTLSMSQASRTADA